MTGFKWYVNCKDCARNCNEWYVDWKNDAMNHNKWCGDCVNGAAVVTHGIWTVCTVGGMKMNVQRNVDCTNGAKNGESSNQIVKLNQDG